MRKGVCTMGFLNKKPIIKSEGFHPIELNEDNVQAMNALRAKAMQKKAEKTSEFIPIDLNEGNVQAIFNRCLKTAETKEIEYAAPFRKEFIKRMTAIGFDVNGI